MNYTVDDVKFIVETLNRPPFSQKLTLVSFDKKSPLELLQVVNDVFAFLDDKHKMDLRDEASDQTAIRMLQFLAVLNYSIEIDLALFKDHFMAGSTRILYPILKWLLADWPQHKNRAYVAKYLRPPDVPEDFFADPSIVALFQQIGEQQALFKELHKSVIQARGNTPEPKQLEADCKQLDQETEQLVSKLAKLEDKVANGHEYAHIANFGQVLAATNALRREQEEESKLLMMLQEQKDALARSEDELRTAQARLRELEQSDLTHESPMKLLERLREDVASKRHLNDEKLEKDIMEKERALRELEHELTGEPMTEDQVFVLEGEIAQLEREIQALTQRRDQLSAGDDKLQFYRDRASAAERKRDKLREQLDELQEEKKEADEEIARLERELNTISSDQERPRTEAQMKEYTKRLADKAVRYKELRSDLDLAQEENKILQHTEDTLSSRVANADEILTDLERAKGIEGYTAAQNALEGVSKDKEDVDSSKGKTLDEISKIVENINQTLKSKKTKLAPLIKELKNVRQKHSEVEADYLRRKRVYEALVAGINGELNELRESVVGARLSIGENESTFHLLTHLHRLDEIKLQQVLDEHKAGSRGGPLREKYEKAIAEQEAYARTLREEKRNLTETHDANVGQRQMFIHLRRLMQAKLTISRDQRARAESEAFMGLGDESDRGVDRLVFEST